MTSSHIATNRAFARNLTSGWLSLSLEVAVAFLLTPFIIMKLGLATYGLWSLAISVIGYLGLIDLGIRGSVGRYINHYMARNDGQALDEVVSTSLAVLSLLGLIALAVAFVVAAYFDHIFPKAPVELLGEIAVVLPLMAIGLWLAFINGVLSNLLAAREKLYLANGIGIATLLVRTLGTVVVLNSGHGLAGLALATVGAAALGCAAHLFAVKRTFGDSTPRLIGFSLPRLKLIARFGAATFMARSASTVTIDAAPLIAMWTLGPEAVGLYSVALTLVLNGKRLSDYAGAAIFASVTKAAALRDFVGLRDQYLRFLRTAYAIGGLVFSGMIVFGGDFLGLWLGKEFTEGGAIVAILSLGFIFVITGSTGATSLQALDRVGLTLRIGLAEAILAVSMMLVLSGPAGLGLEGLALGTMLTFAASGGVIYPWLCARTFGNGTGEMLRKTLLRTTPALLIVVAIFSGIRILIGHGQLSNFALAVGTSLIIYTPFALWFLDVSPRRIYSQLKRPRRHT